MSEVIRPQPGPQTAAFESSADIVVYGGAAFGGKSWWLLVEPLRCIQHSKFRAVIYRRQFKDIMGPGGLWDEALEVYRPFGGTPKMQSSKFVFPSGAEIHFRHLQHEKDVYNEKGMQCSYIGIDEADQFSAKSVWYLKSRNRDGSPVRPRFMLTCNPNGESWIAKFIQWWWDPETGYAIPERSGRKRYCKRLETGDYEWSDSESKEDAALGKLQLSVTFIPAKVTDNVIGLEKNPDYISTLEFQDPVERERLLEGNWNSVDDSEAIWASEYFEGIWVEPEDVPWADIKYSAISLDPSMGKESKDADDSAIVWYGATSQLIYVICDSERRHPSKMLLDLIIFCDDLHSRFREHGNRNWLSLMGIEEVAFSGLLIGELTELLKKYKSSYLYKWIESGNNITPIPAQGSKKFRIRRLSSKFTGHAFKFVKGNLGTVKLLNQARTFPACKHDDALDALEMANRLHLEAGYV